LEKFALLNLLKALDGLSGKTPAGGNGKPNENLSENARTDSGADGGDPLGGILGNLLKSGLMGGNLNGQSPAADNNNGNNNNKGAAAQNAEYTAAPYPVPNVMASVLERHEAMANRLKNKK